MHNVKATFLLSLSLFSLCWVEAQSQAKKLVIKIILGSTREGRTSHKIGEALKQIADTRTDISAEIVDLRDYSLSFLNDQIPPASRKEITDPRIQQWSTTIATADAFIMVVPEYNSGYPGVLKNALDSLYVEWNKKPVAFVGYSGGPSGGTTALAQLRQVTLALQMVPLEAMLTIPTAWKAFDTKNKLIDQTIEQQFTLMLEQLIALQNK